MKVISIVLMSILTIGCATQASPTPEQKLIIKMKTLNEQMTEELRAMLEIIDKLLKDIDADMKDIYVTYYTKEKGKLELTYDEWFDLDTSTIILHSENDKPAIEYVSGDKYWHRDGKQHRVNGKPAVEYADGNKYYCIDSEAYTYEDYKAIIDEVNNMHPALRLTDPREWVREL